MDRETARQEIRKNWRYLIGDILLPAKTKVNGETSYICECGHGKNGDGLTVNPKSKDGNGLKCFGCGWSGDIIDLYEKTKNMDYNTALSLLAQKLGFKLEYPENNFSDQKELDKNMDYTDYYRKCAKLIDDPASLNYLETRGISLEVVKKYGLGFDPDSDPANNPGGMGFGKHTCPRIIIPMSQNHYMGRSVDLNTPPKYAKMNSKGSAPTCFNLDVLWDSDVKEVFVVEGAFDALSVIEAGEAAASLSSTSNVDILLKNLEKKRTSATLILCLDNDKKHGTALALKKLCDGLLRFNIPHVVADICGQYKDPNEALVKDRLMFFNLIQKAKQLSATKPDNSNYYIDRLMKADIDRFKSNIKTGFENLDRKSGGLYSGLYCIAAISSLGKTTFAMQMADQIVAKTDVLFFSLEQSRLELVSKSLARKVAQKDIETDVTSLSIREGILSDQVLEAAEEYKREVGDRISIIEGKSGCNVSFIGDYIRQYISRNNRRPVVFIDYLQILQSESEKWGQSTKEMVDNTVFELKRLSREHALTIFIISSVNRSNYLNPIDFESLKESGGIEYTCDCVWGLQLRCLNESVFDAKENIKIKRERIRQAKAENPRKIELVSLKNRYGVATYSCFFEYYCANDLFVPVEDFKRDSLQKKAGRRI